MVGSTFFLALAVMLQLVSVSFQQDTAIEVAWITGSNISPQYGVFGSKGVPAAGNTPGGTRSAVGAYDSVNRAFYLYGGYGYANSTYGYLVDLWRYSLDAGSWTWLAGPGVVSAALPTYGTKGVASSSTTPSGRYSSAGCFDSINLELWIFGDWGAQTQLSPGQYNDLWKFSTTSGLWTWVAGGQFSGQSAVFGIKGVAAASNVPGGRYDHFMWFDSSANSIWIYGGYGRNDTTAGYLSDIWKYHISSGMWTWVGGPSTVDSAPVYGNKGVPSIDNLPGGRSQFVAYFEQSTRELWLFGGAGPTGARNDLWRYRMNDTTWTWISGSNAVNQASVYGTKGTPSLSNTIGSRQDATGWFDAANEEMWIFGGETYVSSLWRFRLRDGMWTWMAGTMVGYSRGIYGTKSFFNSSNMIGGRISMRSFFEPSTGEAYIFGGFGYDSNQTSTGADLNDLWSLKTAPGGTAPLSAPVQSPQATPPPTTKICSRVTGDGICIIEGNLTLDSSAPTVLIDSPTIINGSLLLQSSSSLRMQVNDGASVNVTGCVSVAGKLIVSANAPNQSVTGGIISAIHFNGGYCDDQKTQFEQTELNLMGGPPCAQLTRTEPKYTTVSVSLMFDYDTSTCDQNVSASALTVGAIVGIAVAAAAAIAIAVASIVWIRCRSVVRPFSQRTVTQGNEL